MSDRKKVLITGTMGNLGTKIRYHLEEQGNYNLVLMSRNPRGDAAIMQEDLSVYNDEWARHFAGVDAIDISADSARSNIICRRVHCQHQWFHQYS